MKQLTKLVGSVALVCGMSVANVEASIIPPLDIDFRTSAWQPAYGQQSYQSGIVTVSAGAHEKLFQGPWDGIGVLSGERDELDWFEALTVSFDVATTLQGVWLTDLYDAPDGASSDGESGYLTLTLADSSTLDLSYIGNDSDQANGEQFIDFLGPLEVTKVEFFVNKRHNNEYSVAGFSVLPEPSMLGLMGAALLAVGVARRRKSQAA